MLIIFVVVPATAVSYDVTGDWNMLANVDYQFNLNLKQEGDKIVGTMKRINGQEPTDTIVGTISPSGRIKFTRYRPNDFTQAYTGQVSSGNPLVMQGTYDHNGQGQYIWSATFLGRVD
jgi:hypothetical protein